MTKFNIHAKIRMAFAIMFSIMLLVAIYLFVQLSTISENTRTLFEHPYRVSNTIREMKIEIFLAENLIRNIRMTDNDRQLDSLKAEIDRKNIIILENFKIVSRQYLGNKASADSAFAMYTAWKNISDKLYQLKKVNRTDSIQILLKNSIIVKFESLVHSLNIISDFADNKAISTYKEVVKTENNSRYISIILLLFAVILVIFLMRYLSQSVILPIKTFVIEANRLLKKEEGSKDIADEQLLLLTLAELKNAYLNNERQSREIELKNNQLAGINSELEDKVKLRTAELSIVNNKLTILYESSQHLASIVESSEDAIISKSLDGKILSWNHAAEKMFGYTAEQAIGENILLIIPPENSNDENIILDKIQKGGMIQHFETARMKRNGEKFPVSISVSSIKDIEGKITGVSKIIRDITQRVRGEENFAASEMRYRCLFESAKDGILILDAVTGMIVDVNPFMTEMLGYSHKEYLGKSIWDVGHFKDIVSNKDNFLELQNNEYIRYEDLPLETSGGQRVHVEFVSNVYLVNNQKVIQCNIRDISERKKKEQALKQAEEKILITLHNLELSNRDLEQFAYVANHDLQEPLRMISSYTQLLERKYKDKLDQDANDYIRFAVDGAIRLQKLLNDLLEFSKINTQSKKNEQVDTSTLLGLAISNLQQLIAGNSALITNDDLPVMKADASQIVRVFQNLIENAIKFHKQTELPKIHITCKKQDEKYQFSVADNGIGIDMQFHDKIFIIFQRLHSVKDYPGTGIGLSICKRIVERHGGTIWFESIVNQGTTFYFTIPVNLNKELDHGGSKIS